MHCRQRQGWHFEQGHFENVVIVSVVLFIFLRLHGVRKVNKVFLKTSPRVCCVKKSVLKRITVWRIIPFQ